jgi:hypothetical protein
LKQTKEIPVKFKSIVEIILKAKLASGYRDENNDYADST